MLRVSIKELNLSSRCHCGRITDLYNKILIKNLLHRNYMRSLFIIQPPKWLFHISCQKKVQIECFKVKLLRQNTVYKIKDSPDLNNSIDSNFYISHRKVCEQKDKPWTNKYKLTVTALTRRLAIIFINLNSLSVIYLYHLIFSISK